MKILAIETSCDETAIALVDAKGGINKPQFNIQKNLVASQIKIHQPFGGVVPNLAKREHLKNLPILFNKILNSKSYILNSIDIIAVTVGPGLEPALWTGINFAKEKFKELKIKNKKLKLIGANHLDGHLYSNILENFKINKNKNIFPAIALIISGGHTILIKMDSFDKYKKIGETRDDAVGEAFDKVARLLNLPYPGGPEIEKIAKKGNPNAINFPRPMLNQKNNDFSFSGLKTAVLYFLKDQQKLGVKIFFHSAALRPSGHGVSPIGETSEAEAPVSELAGRANGSEKKNLYDVAASFQKAAFDVLIAKTLRAVNENKAKSIFISGGVASNKTLKKEFQKAIKKKFSKKDAPILTITKFPTDNAAMIAVAGYINFLRKKNRRLTAKGDISIN
ncbi:tRNA (adenosine(37)-N6)-threonylcarbamoyltransferase complex transferase subunit TsaD [Candidatus Wolfebacteria bacterium]|nr:tRNA (adenosine(37)-N6)-threonylcarbamoyltransferase complex transferase subunit TsaD [Candidatus Wolfebacteria bacterium]